ncbi:TNF receptor-associated factor1a [Sesamum alatum]|uniref:TNF receptor-associated factor1a n=1 Tax=Sesamum alatum TaxID=300844 RepID=A0AAE1Y0K7_9LAMI|nr:TNF receptor-associated factor1a [Sesamum alatum]
MAGVAIEESGAGRLFEGISSGQQQQCQAGEALAEWRSSEQVENGSPSTSPPYWDRDDDDDGGPKPSELYGKYTWKIDKFSQINKRNFRAMHLRLEATNGWSHFAQFTIAVVNKDPKKSKYSDTLHRFWKKEHD